VPELGRAALVVAFGLILYAAVAGGYAAFRGRRRLHDSATNALFASLGAVAVAALVLVAALVRHDFSLVYVADHTSRELPFATPSPPSGAGSRDRCSSGSSYLPGWARRRWP
jgi:cytochrome c-type biogenesis protein CcmF